MKTKIMVTIGPASNDLSSIRKYAKVTDLFRLNGSHGNLNWHEETVNKIRSVHPQAFILLDIPGVKPRSMNDKVISIKYEQEIAFGSYTKNSTSSSVNLTKPLPVFRDKPSIFSVNDGQYLFKCTDYGTNFIVGESLSNFNLLPRKGINIPNSVYDEELQYEIYEEFIYATKDFEIDALGLSFVQTGSIIDRVRKIAPHRLLISKIENSEGLRNYTNIVDSSDAIMIDRGDLAAEIGLENLFHSTELIVAETKRNGKPLIMATENLETMLQRDLPSKSEVISLAHSITIGVDCIMLSEETAVSENGQKIVKWLSSFLTQPIKSESKMLKAKTKYKFPEIWNAVAQLRSIPVIVLTKSGHALFDFFSAIPDGTLTIVTHNRKIHKISQIYANMINVIDAKISTEIPLEIMWNVIEENKETLYEENQQIAAIYVSKYVNKPRANTRTIFDKNDFI